MQAWVMLGVGSASGEKKKQNQQKRIGNEEPTEMAALGPGKVSMGNGKNKKEQKERQKDSAMIWCNPPLSLLERERERSSCPCLCQIRLQILYVLLFICKQDRLVSRAVL